VSSILPGSTTKSKENQRLAGEALPCPPALGREQNAKSPADVGENAGSMFPARSGEFEPLEHSVYEGRRRLGCYVRIAPTWYAAFDAEDRPLGEFSGPQDAYTAVAAISGNV
jgi:hypothetical protein